MATIASLFVDLRANAARFAQDLESAHKDFRKFSNNINGIGRGLTAGLTVPLLGIGVAAGKAANDIDESMDLIRTRTGATGQALQDLGKDLRTVLNQVPQSVDKVSEAIAGLNQRLGLTGAPLQAMATQMLNLARLSGSEVGPLIQATTRIFGDWKVATENQSAALDLLFKTSQQSGIGVQRLSELVTQFGAPLRQMGFSLEESAALLGKFEKEGVNTEQVLGGLRIALARMAKEGVTDAGKALATVSDQIKNMGDAGKANAVAVELFGRSGIAMASAIREGRLELDEFVAKVKASPDSINKAAAETRSFGEVMGELRNKVTLALAPLGDSLLKVFDNLQPVILGAVEKIRTLIDWFGRLSPETQKTIAVIGGLAAVLGPAILAFGAIASSVSAFAGTMGALLPVVAALAPVVAALALAIGAIKLVSVIADFETMIQKFGRFNIVTQEATDKAKAFGEEIERSFGVVVSKTGKSFQEWTDDMVVAKASMEDFKNKVKEGKISFEGFGFAAVVAANSTAKVEAPIKNLGGGLGILTDAQKKAAEEMKRLVTEFNKSLRPASDLEAKYKQLSAAGIPLLSFARAYSDEIIKAAEAQKQNTGTLSPLILKLEAMASVEKAANAELIGLKNTLNLLPPPTEGAEKSMRGFLSELNAFRIQEFLKNGLNPLLFSIRELPGSLSFIDKAAREMLAKMPTTLDPEQLNRWTRSANELFAVTKATAVEVSDVWAKQISTIVTDFSKGVADIIFQGRGLGETLKGIFQEFGKGIVRTLIESVFAPLEGLFKKFGKMMADLFSGGGIGAVIGGIGVAAAAVVPLLVNLFKKDPLEQGAKEVARDLGGLEVGKDIVEIFLQGIGLNKSQFSNIRKEILSSPKFLTEVALPAAQSQGKTEEFMASLGPMEEAFRIGQITGDFSKLNAKFIELYGSSKALAQAMPDFANKLAALNGEGNETWKTFQRLLAEFESTGKVSEELAGFIEKMGGNLEAFNEAARIPELRKAQESFQTLRLELEKMGKPAKDMIATFLETGDVTDELADKLNEFGLDIADFENFAQLSKLRGSFEQLGETFLETGKGIEDLRKIFIDFGGDVSVLDNALQLPGLRSSLNELSGWGSELDSLLPKQETFFQNMFRMGTVSEEAGAKIIAAGGNLAKFQELADIGKVRTDFQGLSADLLKTGIVSKELLDIVSKFGSPDLANQLVSAAGSKDTEAINSILTTVGENINTEFTKVGREVAGEIEKMKENVSQKITELTEAVRTELANVQTKIELEWNNARVDLIGKLEGVRFEIESSIGELQSALATAISGLESAILGIGPAVGAAIADSVTGSFALGGIIPKTGLAFMHEGEAVLSAKQTDAMRDILAGEGDRSPFPGSEKLPTPFSVVEQYRNQLEKEGKIGDFWNSLSEGEREQYTKRNIKPMEVERGGTYSWDDDIGRRVSGKYQEPAAEAPVAVNLTFNISSIDAKDTSRYIRDAAMPEIIRMIESNISGARVKLKQELGIA